MHKSKLAIVIDSIASSTIFSFILFVWLRKYIKNAFLIIFITILMNIMLFIVFFKTSIKKYNISKIKISDKKLADDCFIKITFMSPKELTVFYENLLKANHIKSHFFKNEYSYFYINLHSELTKADLISASNFYSANNNPLPLVFISTAYSEEFLSLATNLNFKYYLYYYDDIFSLMKENNLFPITATKTQNKTIALTLKNCFQKVKSSLSRNRFKSFFFSGLSLLAFSLFIPYSIYYLIIGSSLLILSICCLFSKEIKFKKPEKQTLISFTKKDV